MECVKGCDVVACRGGTALDRIFYLICTDYTGCNFVLLNILSSLYQE